LLDTTCELLYFSSAFAACFFVGPGSVSKVSLRLSNPSPIGRPLPIVCSHGRVLQQFQFIAIDFEGGTRDSASTWPTLGLG
jgi:hypothetical protein